MSQFLSPRDLEQLSAYLDQQLSREEYRQIEKRLQVESNLRYELEELRQTRFLLRSLSYVHVPRNFTLAPHLFGAQPYRSSVPILSFASAVAAALLIFLLVGEWLFTRSLGAATPVAANLPPTQPALLFEPAEQTVEAESAEAETTAYPEPYPFLEQPALEMAAPAAAPTAVTAAATATPAPTTAPAVETMGDALPPQEAISETIVMQKSVAEEAVGVEAAVEASDAITLSAITSSEITPTAITPILALPTETAAPPPTEIALRQAPEVTLQIPPTEQAQDIAVNQSPRIGLRWLALEIALGIAALGMGLAALLLRRKY